MLLHDPIESSFVVIMSNEKTDKCMEEGNYGCLKRNPPKIYEGGEGGGALKA